MEGEKKGRRRALVTKASGLLKGSRYFGGCRLEQRYSHDVVGEHDSYALTHYQTSGDLASM